LPSPENYSKDVKGYNYLRGMLKKINKPLALLFIGSVICTCIDPFNPDIRGKEALLVVDALLTDENRSYTVELSRTTKSQNEDSQKVSGALVTISDLYGNVTRLSETTNGVYKSDSLAFQGETSNTYVLYIKTYEGNEYKSEPCTMSPASQIDSIYYQKDQEILNNSAEILDGIRIYLNYENSGTGRNYRWIFDEWWKFSVPFPKQYNYIDQNNIPRVEQVEQVCYGHNGSSEILINSTEGTQTGSIEGEPILFVPSGRSDRFLIEYCIDIKQLSLSDKEFQFWKQMKEINEGGGDIFNKQPFSVVGNIHNINNAAETVLGFFQVSAVEEKRLFIKAEEIKDLGLPAYSYNCERVEIGPGDYPVPTNPAEAQTFDKINESYTNAGYIFTAPFFDIRGNLQRLVFTKPVCALCTTRGNLAPPDFWIDMDLSQRKK
jgi:hypothetical protein